MPKVCSVEGCGRAIHAKGLCDPHYRKALIESRRGKVFCTIAGCNRPLYARGMCTIHYDRMRKDGDALRPEKIVREGLKKDNPIEYHSWITMKDRCYNKNATSYYNYGGRGIKVCDRWLEKPYGFKNFLEDMGKCPTGLTISGRREFTLDRIDVNGDYTPENCRWADKKIQSVNRRPPSEWRRGLCGQEHFREL